MITLLCALAWALPDRAAPPSVAPSVPMDLPDAAVIEVAPGLRVHHLRVPGVLRAVVDIQFGHGSVAVGGASNEAFGTLDATWTLASESYPPDELEDLQARHDLDLYTFVGDETTLAGISVPLASLEQGLDVLVDVVLHPVFDAVDVRRVVRDGSLFYTLSAPHDAGTLLRNVANVGWYPATDPRRDVVDLAALRRVRSAPLLALHDRMIHGAPIDVTVVGDFDVAAVLAKLEPALAPLAAPAPRAARVGPRPVGTPRTLGVDLPEQDQTWLSVSLPAPAFNAPDAPVFGLVAHALAGHFLSRLNLLLREEKGWTYGSRGSWSPDDNDGRWVFTVDVDEKNAGPALEAALAEIAKMAEGGLSAEELSTAQRGLAVDWNLSLSTADGASGFWGALVEQEELVAHERARLDAALAATVDDTRAVASRWLSSPDRLITVVGDRAAVAAALDGVLGAPLTWHVAAPAALGQLVPAPASTP